MKPIFCTFFFFSSLLFLVSSCSDRVQSTQAESAEEQQLGDNQILNIMMAIDKQEIAAAQEATKKRVSPAVASYSKYLIQQHQSSLDELNQLAKQLKLDPKESAISKSLATNGKQDLKTLSELQDQAFDKAFIDAMIKGHREGLEVIDTKLLPQAKNPQLQVFVEQFRRMVADHLEKGLRIQNTL